MELASVGQVVAFVVVFALLLPGLIWNIRGRRRCAFCKHRVRTGAIACPKCGRVQPWAKTGG